VGGIGGGVGDAHPYVFDNNSKARGKNKDSLFIFSFHEWMISSHIFTPNGIRYLLVGGCRQS
jgi:hypothetical protein